MRRAGYKNVQPTMRLLTSDRKSCVAWAEDGAVDAGKKTGPKP